LVLTVWHNQILFFKTKAFFWSKVAGNQNKVSKYFKQQCN